MVGKRAAHVSVHDGAEFLDSDFRVVGLLSSYDFGQSGITAQACLRAAQSGLWADRHSARCPFAVVQTADASRGDRDHRVGCLKSDLLVICPISAFQLESSSPWSGCWWGLPDLRPDIARRSNSRMWICTAAFRCSSSEA